MKNLIQTAFWLNGRSLAVVCSLVAACMFSTAVSAADLAPEKASAKTASKGRRAAKNEDPKEYQANNLLLRGQELLEAKQEDRGIKTIMQIAQQYPDSKAAVKAEIVLSNYYIEKKQFDSAVQHLLKIVKSDDPEIECEALYKLGICYYNQNQYNQAFTSLRQVVNKFAGSIYANEAYYYIGLCHFKQNRWNQAVESLERVGTSIPPEEMSDSSKKEILAEAGQRVFIKISDEDLIVMNIEDENAKLIVEVTNKNGDKEKVEMEKMGKDNATFIGSIPTKPGIPVPGNNVLETMGGDVVTVEYVDAHTASGETNRKMLSKITLVSTATTGFTNGSYQEYSHGILAEQDIFMRVRDLDCDVTPQPDKVTVTVKSIYKVEKPKDELSTGIDFDNEEPEFKVRDTREYVLTEDAPRSGVFVGSSKTNYIDPDNQLESAIVNDAPNGPLKVQRDDTIIVEFLDKVHILGHDPVTRSFKAPLLVGKQPNVKIITPHIDDLEIKAKKNLIEAKLLLHLSQIFKEMGLIDKANERAATGIEKVDEVLKINAEAALEHSILEDTFNTKWELLIVQDKIKEAIAVCSMLIKTFPDSALVDRALIKIAQIKIMEGSDRSVAEGLNIYRGILQLPKSDMKAEAQYSIAEVIEEQTKKNAKERQAEDPTFKPNFGQTMLEYKKCADNYPDSPFAGKAMGKIIEFYMDQRDFARVVEMMDQIFRDYPDAEFLDQMLFKWAQAEFELGHFKESREKCDQLISEYPNSKESARAQRLRQLIDQKTNSASEE